MGLSSRQKIVSIFIFTFLANFQNFQNVKISYVKTYVINRIHKNFIIFFETINSLYYETYTKLKNLL